MGAPVPEITPEIRAEVYRLDCAQRGHLINYLNVVQRDQGDGDKLKVVGPPGQLPHLRCSRCDAVWICADEDGTESPGYEAAASKLAGKMKNPADAQTRRPRPQHG